MNVHDSIRMESVLRAAGGVAVDGPEEADLVVFNTCSVREKAEQKLRSEVGKLAAVKLVRPGLVVAVAGCVAQQEGEQLLGRVRHIDLVVGPDNVSELPALLAEQMSGAPPLKDFPAEHEACPDGADRALDGAIMTHPDARDPELMKKLAAIVARALAAAR